MAAELDVGYSQLEWKLGPYGKFLMLEKVLVNDTSKKTSVQREK